ncbi:peptidoglycan editing factor PgeF [uncultured Marinobacter sp.]|uniref:peptidoglycan editing factor PgeF n=1 Tax=uncultured Marinobacter sp. TaxID=187379 RepID=UPI0030DCED74|tara:strand:+ start:251 stop:1027 length:777 start_codon:yes stop_codon:yes gene_type:complete
MCPDSFAEDTPLIVPDWPAPERVRAFSTTRLGGVSTGRWGALNLGGHVGDDPSRVHHNRERLARWCALEPERFGWLNQVHGVGVATLPVAGVPDADAAVAGSPGQVCVVLTADCLPVLFCNRQGTRVAAAHAGWRGLASGVLARVVTALGEPAELMAWLGPAIGPAAFEVGPEVKEAFVQHDPDAEAAFTCGGARPGHLMADLFQLARLQLRALGVRHIYGGDFCTWSDAERFYSYRRDGQTGRMASGIWIDASGRID